MAAQRCSLVMALAMLSCFHLAESGKGKGKQAPLPLPTIQPIPPATASLDLTRVTKQSYKNFIHDLRTAVSCLVNGLRFTKGKPDEFIIVELQLDNSNRERESVQLILNAQSLYMDAIINHNGDNMFTFHLTTQHGQTLPEKRPTGLRHYGKKERNLDIGTNYADILSFSSADRGVDKTTMSIQLIKKSFQFFSGLTPIPRSEDKKLLGEYFIKLISFISEATRFHAVSTMWETAIEDHSTFRNEDKYQYQNKEKQIVQLIKAWDKFNFSDKGKVTNDALAINADYNSKDLSQLVAVFYGSRLQSPSLSGPGKRNKGASQPFWSRTKC